MTSGSSLSLASWQLRRGFCRVVTPCKRAKLTKRLCNMLCRVSFSAQLTVCSIVSRASQPHCAGMCGRQDFRGSGSHPGHAGLQDVNGSRAGENRHEVGSSGYFGEGQCARSKINDCVGAKSTGQRTCASSASGFLKIRIIICFLCNSGFYLRQRTVKFFEG